MRVLVTGSRDWPYPSVVESELNRVLANLPMTETLTVVEGACPTGADAFAYQWVFKALKAGGPVKSERHPADWAKHGKAAGPIRNQEMIDLGADLCLAFWHNASRGTHNCYTRASVAGIPVRLLTLDVTEMVGVR